ncbi:aminoglycoside N(3)-acetyltransferase [Rummeliibacillus pycnus]|uniref:aminoglycoside N(3)-acetyltransferase n=1 Tax=Rummeliibacillus pycnus TaxID=101070 RepID=UPI000C9B57F6|nr:AAC(3) family N-acetyltransferase [Rummeliibacillus pycnus]
MTEFDIIQKTDEFQSKETLIRQLHLLGIQEGDSIIVHSSLSQMGWIAGAEQAVVEALMHVITPNGTIVMPAQSTGNSEPSYWSLPPVPEAWQQPVRDSIPAYNPHLTPLRGMGKIAECFLRHSDTIRSAHPAHSFMAWGKNAKNWMSHHPLENSFGLESPLGKMYQTSVKIMLIGVNYDSCTALHLSEYLANQKYYFKQGAAILINGKRQWVTYNMLDVDSERFPAIGKEFEVQNGKSIHYGKLGQARTRIIPMRPLVDFGVEWLNTHHVQHEQ